LLSPIIELSEEQEKIKKTIVEFLNQYIALMPIEVAKNWTKLEQYFEVFLNFLFIYLNVFLKFKKK